MTEVKVEGSGPQALVRRWWWLIVLLLLALGFLCVAIGPGKFLITPAPEPTEAATDTPPNDAPTETAGATEEGGDSSADEPTEEATPTEKATPTEEATEEPTATVEVTEVYYCGLNPNDGVCCIGVENTDLDTASCKCDGDGTCEITEGFNCGDCQGATCGSACTKNADCKNPYLTCSDGKCDGDICPGPAPTKKCQITDCQQQVSWPSYQGETDCVISCPGGGSWVDPSCQVAGPTCG